MILERYNKVDSSTEAITGEIGDRQQSEMAGFALQGR